MEWFVALVSLWLGPWSWLSFTPPAPETPMPKDADVIYPDRAELRAVDGDRSWAPLMSIAELRQWSRMLQGLRRPPQIQLPPPSPPEPSPKSADDIYGPDHHSDSATSINPSGVKAPR